MGGNSETNIQKTDAEYINPRNGGNSRKNFVGRFACHINPRNGGQ